MIKDDGRIGPLLSLADERIAVAEMVSQALGCAISHFDCQVISRPNPVHRVRRYVKHVLHRDGSSGEPIVVFVKSGLRRSLFYESLQGFLSGLELAEFRVPTFFGMLRLGSSGSKTILGVWEYIPVEGRLPDAREWGGAREAVVLAAAAMTAISEDLRRAVPNIRDNIEFVRPLAQTAEEALANYARRGFDLASLRPGMAKLAKFEAGALERLSSLGDYFTHNDYRRANMFLNPGKKPVIFDWDSASLGPPGATLRFMARLPKPEQREAAELYCTRLRTRGLRFRPKDVLFSMRAVEVCHALVHAARFSAADDLAAERTFRWGLDHIHYLAA